jgi:hypothetical protein
VRARGSRFACPSVRECLLKTPCHIVWSWTVGSKTVRVLVTGGIGVLGRALLPLLEAAGHEISPPEPQELDLLDARQVEAATRSGSFRRSSLAPPAQAVARSAAGHAERTRRRRPRGRIRDCRAPRLLVRAQDKRLVLGDATPRDPSRLPLARYLRRAQCAGMSLERRDRFSPRLR